MELILEALLAISSGEGVGENRESLSNITGRDLGIKIALFVSAIRWVIKLSYLPVESRLLAKSSLGSTVNQLTIA